MHRSTPKRPEPKSRDEAVSASARFGSSGSRWHSWASALPCPHVDADAKVRIDTIEVIESKMGRRQLRFVLAWAELHQDEPSENWRRVRAGETLQAIEPLR
jgi:hypothetical protein